MHPPTTAAWPYPRWIAHRGAGKLAPENTLAALRLGASHGYRMFECDAKLSADGVVFLLHDAGLQRTTDTRHLPNPDAASNAGALPWNILSQLDAGHWHSPAYAGEPLPTLHAVAQFCIANGYHLNIEIKASPGQERITGEAVAALAARLWQGQSTPPLLSSFDVAALEGAQATQPELPRALLIDRLWPHHWSDWLAQAAALQCRALVCQYGLWDAASVEQARARGLRCLSYTVNHADEVRRLLALGMDGLITDRIDLFSPE